MKKFKHITIREEQYWEIKKRMAKLKISKFHNYMEKLLQTEQD